MPRVQSVNFSPLPAASPAPMAPQSQMRMRMAQQLMEQGQPIRNLGDGISSAAGSIAGKFARDNIIEDESRRKAEAQALRQGDMSKIREALASGDRNALMALELQSPGMQDWQIQQQMASLKAPQYKTVDLDGDGKMDAQQGPGGQLTAIPKSPHAPNVAATPAHLAGMSAEQQRAFLLQKASAGASRTRINTGESSSNFGKTLGKKFADRLDTASIAADSARNSLATIGELEALVDQGINTGTGATFQNAVEAAFNKMGIGDGDFASRGQAFSAGVGRLVGDVVKMFGSGQSITDADVKRAMGIAGGDVTMTEDALRFIFDINRRAAKRAIEGYNGIANRAYKMAGDDSSNTRIAYPQYDVTEKAGLVADKPQSAPIPPLGAQGAAPAIDQTATPAPPGTRRLRHKETGEEFILHPDGRMEPIESAALGMPPRGTDKTGRAMPSVRWD